MRPNISFSVKRLFRRFSAPTQAHWAAAETFMRYRQGTRDWSIIYGAKLPLFGYSDADYAGDVETRSSTTGKGFVWARGSYLRGE